MSGYRITEKRDIIPEGFGGFSSCHASTLLALPDGALLAAYFAGSGEGCPDSAIWLSRRVPGSRDWEAPRRVKAEAGRPHWNPALFYSGGEVCLFYKVGATVQNWENYLARSRDGGASFTEGVRTSGPGEMLGPVKNKPILLSDGRVLSPSSVESGTLWDAYADLSDVGFGSFSRRAVPFRHGGGGELEDGLLWQGLRDNALWENDLQTISTWDGVIQPSAWESAPGRCHMLMRSTRGRVYRSDSEDGGETWCEAYPTQLPNNNSGLDLVKCGPRLALVCNPVSGNWACRTPLTLSFSEDNGLSFGDELVLEDGPGEYSYPAVIWDGAALHISYTRDRRNIRYARAEPL